MGRTHPIMNTFVPEDDELFEEIRQIGVSILGLARLIVFLTCYF